MTPRDMYPPDTYPKDMYPPVTYPLDTYPLDTYPLGHTPPVTYPLDTYPRVTYPLGHIPPRTYSPQTLKCSIWFMHHVLITYCTLRKLFCRNSIYLGCRCNKADNYLLCQEGLIPQLLRLTIFKGGGAVVPMSDVNLDKHPSCLS